MTLDQILNETQKWPASQVDELIKALVNQPHPAPKGNHSRSLEEFAKQLDAIWEGGDARMTTDEIEAWLRANRSRRE